MLLWVRAGLIMSAAYSVTTECAVCNLISKLLQITLDFRAATVAFSSLERLSDLLQTELSSLC